MPCPRYREALADVAAGEPPRSEVEAHMAGCAACRSELDELRAALRLADAALGDLLAEAPGSGLRERILRAAAEDAGDGRPAGGRPAWILFAGGSLAAAALLVAVWRQGSPARGPQESPAPPRTVQASPVPDAEAPGARGAAVVAEPARRPRIAKPRREEPEVLVPPDEAEALWRFAASLRERVVEPGSLVTGDPEAPLLQPRPIDLVP